jgi:hypothetical protein
MNNTPRIRPLVRLVAFPNDASTFRVTSKGVAILTALFALKVAALWRLLPW